MTRLGLASSLLLFASALVAPASAAAQASLLTCEGGGFGTALDASFTNGGLGRSALDDGSFAIPEATIREVFGPAGVPFSTAGTEVYVNVNGNVSFGAPLYQYTPDAIPGLSTPAVAAFFGDVDLRDDVPLLPIFPTNFNPGSIHLCVESDGDEDVVTSGDRIMITWHDVVRYDSSDGFNGAQTNSFQLLLTVPDATCGTSPETAGLDVEFRYGELTWTTGDASGGSGGFGGTEATAGLDDGEGNAIALPGSGTAEVLMLVSRSNVGEPGVFRVRSWGGALSDCGNGSLDACEVCDGDDVASGLACPAGYTGTPLCNNDPDNAAGDGTCTLDPVPDGCADVDECAAGTATCSADATCMNTDGGFLCACGPGLTGDGFTCHDLVVLTPEDGGTVTDPTPPITGTAEPGAEIVIVIDGVEVGRTFAADDGAFSFTPMMALSEGAHAVEVTAIGSGGSTATETVDFMVDLATTVMITAPADGAVIGDTTPRITGRAEPGATVEITVDGVVVATVTADASGDWEHTPSDPLADGSHTVDVVATDTSGNVATDSSTFEVDGSLPELDITSPPDAGATNDTTPTITGTADPGASVEVRVDGDVIGTATADGAGDWSLETTEALAEGEHTVEASTTDGAGRGASDTHTFRVDTEAPALAVTSPEEGEAVTDATPTIAGTGEPGALVTVAVDGEVIGTVIVGEDGTWSLTPTEPLEDGDHTIEATATDAAGNATIVERGFSVDTGGVDTDGDGVPDATECPGDVDPCPDTDGDGTPDDRDPDDDGDGVPTRDERPDGMDRDTDDDGTPDYLDPDDDGDTIPTREERPDGMDRDTDDDGTPDYLDPDDDGDTIPTATERMDGEAHGDDPDMDDLPNWLDTDSDGDGAGDREEGRDDDDMDGVPNYLDPDQGETVTGGLTGGGGCSAGAGGTDGGWLVVLALLGLGLVRRREVV